MDLWVRAGLRDNTVKELWISGDIAVPEYALVVGRGVYRSMDDSVTWLAVNNGLPTDGWGRVNVHEIAVDSADPSFMYAGRRDFGHGDSALSAGLYWTDDAGATWLVSGQELAGKAVQVITVVPRPGGARSSEDEGSQRTSSQDEAAGVVYVATSGEIYRSTNRGRAWEPLHWRGVETKIESLAIHPENPDAVYVGTQGSGLYATDNGGVSWKVMNEGLDDLNVHDIAMVTVDPRRMYLATDSGVYRSGDAGSSWAKLGGATSGRSINSIALHPQNGDLLCVGLQRGGAYCSMDGGAQWMAVKRGLGALTVLTLTLDPRDPSILWAGTTDGVWRYVFGTPVPVTVTPVQSAPRATPRPGPAGPPASGPVEAATMTVHPSATASPTASGTATPTVTLTASHTSTPTATPTVESTATRPPAPTPTFTAPPPPPTAIPPSPSDTPVPTR